MAIWSDPTVEALLGGPLDRDGITYEAIAGLVPQEATESELVDFKSKLWAKGTAPEMWSEREFAKDVAALANRRGGVLIVGVKEVQGQAVEICPLQLEHGGEQEEQRLRRALVNFQAPLALCEFVWLENSDSAETLLVIVVPRSVRSPHAIVQPDESLRYPIRHGMDTEWLTEHDVAEQYRARFRGQEAQDALVRDALGGLANALTTAEGLWHFAVVVPETPAVRRLDASALAEVEAWYRAKSRMGSPCGGELPVRSTPLAAPGRARFTIHADTWEGGDDEVRAGYLELHLSGTVAVARRLDQFDRDNEPRSVGTVVLVDHTVLALEIGLSWASHQAGAAGIADVVVGIADAGSGRLEVDEPVALYAFGDLGYRRVTDSRAAHGLIRCTVAADLASSSSVSDRVRVSASAVTELHQHFGRPESRLLPLDGRFRLAGSRAPWAQSVRGWCEAHDVPVSG